ncbi:alpha/beta hydrolase [Cytobacillus purgationiresistens]|uniref:alpha/beta hydrolase n=1 Tax=Cytobacillus purgationiresistens TaxID=863449 RepID=UPI0027D8090C|nr:alpha/beta fold hydrolase [Cytobacillus purgationiresistens]
MIGCMCVHGFTGSPYEVEPLSAFLKQHTDWEVVCPTLPGHGELLALRGIQYKIWIEHAEKELEKLFEKCETVYVVGFSMGGMIASNLAVRYPVEKLVLLSAAAYYVNPKQLLIDIGEMVREGIKGRIKDNELYKRYKRKIKSTPITATLQFRKLVSSVRPLLNQVNVPTLIAQGESDGIVPVKSAQYLYQTIGTPSKKLIFFKDSNHLICHCNEKERLFDEVLDFLGK